MKITLICSSLNDILMIGLITCLTAAFENLVTYCKNEQLCLVGTSIFATGKYSRALFTSLMNDEMHKHMRCKQWKTYNNSPFITGNHKMQQIKKMFKIHATFIMVYKYISVFREHMSCHKSLHSMFAAAIKCWGSGLQGSSPVTC